MPDDVMERIGRAVALHHGQGEREAARVEFQRIWDDIGGPAGDPLAVAVLAHSMADVQDDVRDELVWDQRAFTAAGLLPAERSAGLYPSLHLNLGDCYRRLGDLDRAREHLELARAGMGALGDDAYGDLIRRGLDLLTRQLEP